MHHRHLPWFGPSRSRVFTSTCKLTSAAAKRTEVPKDTPDACSCLPEVLKALDNCLVGSDSDIQSILDKKIEERGEATDRWISIMLLPGVFTQNIVITAPNIMLEGLGTTSAIFQGHISITSAPVRINSLFFQCPDALEQTTHIKIEGTRNAGKITFFNLTTDTKTSLLDAVDADIEFSNCITIASQDTPVLQVIDSILTVSMSSVRGTVVINATNSRVIVSRSGLVGVTIFEGGLFLCHQCILGSSILEVPVFVVKKGVEARINNCVVYTTSPYLFDVRPDEGNAEYDPPHIYYSALAAGRNDEELGQSLRVVKAEHDHLTTPLPILGGDVNIGRRGVAMGFDGSWPGIATYYRPELTKVILGVQKIL